jgi:DNA-binding protein HU-beta
MHKTDVIRHVARETRLSQRVVGDVLRSTHRLIEETLRDGRTVTFPGFGTFRTSHRRAGKVKNIKTGEPIAYPERRVVVFHVGEILKRAVRGEHRRGGGLTKALGGLLRRRRTKKQ